MKETNDSLNVVSPTIIPNMSEQGIIGGKQHRKAGIYRITFDDLYYVIGWAGDLYAKANATVKRINAGVFPRYPRGTEIVAFDVISTEKGDLKILKERASSDPKYLRTLQRVKKPKPSATERYRKRREKGKKVNPLVEAHRANPDSGSPLERLRKQGAKVTEIKPRQPMPPLISSSRWIAKSNQWLDWDKANNQWRTRSADANVGATTSDYYIAEQHP